MRLMKTGSVRINGFEMYCQQDGQGEPLLLLHGFTGCSDDWLPFVDRLIDGHRLIIPDLRGHGRSTNPGMSFTHRQSALDVLALLDSLGIDRCDAIGTSAGAKTLLHVATRQTSRLRRMVLVSGAPYYPAQARALMAVFSGVQRSEDEWQFMRSRHKRGDDQIRALWAQGNIFATDYDDMNFTPPHLTTIAAETLIVHGDRDPFYPAGLALEMYTAIPRARLWIVPNGGHVPISGDQASQFAATASAFLR
jgi:pimeloyl-ACP methyl ester carboxylesterase